MTAAVQARLDLVAIEDGVARFGSGTTAYAVAVLDVVGADASLASADDTTQDELADLLAQAGPVERPIRSTLGIRCGSGVGPRPCARGVRSWLQTD